MRGKVWSSQGSIPSEVPEMIVVKIGGAVGTQLDNLVSDISGRKDVLIVHGGSDEMNKLSEQLGRPPRFVTSPSGHESRVTDGPTLDLLRMTYSGLVNKRFVEMLRKGGVNAIGLSGIDGGLLQGKRKGSVRYLEEGRVKVLHDDNTGTVERVNTDLLELLLSGGYVPVLTIPIEAEDHGSLNADADRVAAAVAGAVKAEALVLLTNKPGLLKDPEDPTSLVRKVPRSELDAAMELARGRMKKKVLAAREALEQGVPKVVISSANSDRPLTRAMSGEGTVLC
ncbi:MAG: [LysW]-aminoadipate kinase [Candidatus Thermoplasmatota archaeon]|jgi:acetylglutamate/LysW-gamma-L-alpha-aminoadipate kinase|nr:[LysW]-aminoadipate kinase [Candidatus Thermoplasmatota archaeon]